MKRRDFLTVGTAGAAVLATAAAASAQTREGLLPRLRGCLKIGIVSSAFICYTSAVFHSGAEL